jgi:hypothetical protein
MGETYPILGIEATAPSLASRVRHHFEWHARKVPECSFVGVQLRGCHSVLPVTHWRPLMNTTNRHLFAGIMALVLAGAACGGGGSQEKLDPCSLVTKAEAEQILKVTIDPPTYEQNVSTVRACVYASDEPFVEVRVALLEPPSPITPEEQYQSGFTSAQPVAGLGEKARCNEAPTAALIKVSTLMVLAEDRVLQVVADTCATALAFAKLAVPRL